MHIPLILTFVSYRVTSYFFGPFSQMSSFLPFKEVVKIVCMAIRHSIISFAGVSVLNPISLCKVEVS